MNFIIVFCLLINTAFGADDIKEQTLPEISIKRIPGPFGQYPEWPEWSPDLPPKPYCSCEFN